MSNKYVYLKDFTGINDLTSAEGPIPKPGRGQVLVRVHAVSLNYHNLVVAKGGFKGFYNHPENLIPTCDGAGEIIELGEGVRKRKVGERVYATVAQTFPGGQIIEDLAPVALGGGIHGMLTQYQVLSEDGVIPFPDHLSYEEASTLPCAGTTAFNSFFEAPHPLKAGDTVLILGTGGVSIFGLQFAKATGARVIVTSSSDEKLEIAKKLGADEFINYNKEPEWQNKVLELTGGRGVDHVLEVGGGNTLQKSLQSTRIMGHIGVIGFVAGGEEKGVAMNILAKSLHVRGIMCGSTQTSLEMNRLIGFHKLKPFVDKVFPFEQYIEAYKYLESQKSIGKVVIKL